VARGGLVGRLLSGVLGRPGRGGGTTRVEEGPARREEAKRREAAERLEAAQQRLKQEIPPPEEPRPDP